ncbi:MAG: amidohydrolase, partial [Bacteroidota bacterium]
QEEKSAALLKDKLSENGFTIKQGVANIPTAFIASYGSGKPVIAILGEFDALPGVSQTSSPFREKRTDVNAGHACGHHLFGAGSMAAAIEVKDWMKANNIEGTLRFYGTPAEEGGAGKVYMVREGLFDDVDAVLHWHPSNSNSANAASSLANKSAKFRFYGVASHAAGSPWNGRSALDGVEAMNMMVNMMREHISPESRIHHVITSGGEAPNVVPEFAEVFYYCRHPEMAMVKQNFEWMVAIAEAAAKGTQTKMEYEVIHGLYNVLPNETLARVVHNNLSQLGGIEYTSEETEYANKIIESFEYASNVSLRLAKNIAPFKVIRQGRGGSTDVGDVSWTVPTAGLRTATWVPGTSAHT